MSGIAHLGRMILFFLTAGFMYPNVFVEGLDATKHDAGFKAKNNKV